MKFEYQVWRLRPECRGAAPDINNLAHTHILIADGVFAELPADLDADVLDILTMDRHVEAIADAWSWTWVTSLFTAGEPTASTWAGSCR